MTALARCTGVLVLATATLSATPLLLGAQCPDGTPPPCGRPAPRAAVPEANSVAVLYFDNLSRDTADSYLADGLTEEIIDRLGQLRRLTVKTRYAVRRYRGAGGREPAAIGQALGVRYLVTGSVRRAGARLRIGVELVRAASGDRLWGEQYDRTGTDLLDIEAAIAQSVAAAIAGRLGANERASLAARPTENPEAYDHFLRGNHYLAQRTAPGVGRAVEEYRAAARLDPSFPAAYARLGLAHGLYLVWGWEFPGTPRESLLAQGFEAADRALQLDARSAEGWMARGYLLYGRYPVTFDSVRVVFERAIALDPRNAEAHHQFGSALRTMGNDAESEQQLRRALALEPGRPISLQLLAEVQAAQRRFADAKRSLDTAVATDSSYFYALAARARIEAATGDLARARADAEAATRMSAGTDSLWGPAALAIVEARQGDTAAARAHVDVLRRAFAGARLSPQVGSSVAAILAALGEREQALNVLEAVRPRGGRLWFYMRMAELDALRGDPRFQRLVEAARPPEAPR
jgi:TolB-like protein/Tfp pilus assembly protein PilF